MCGLFATIGLPAGPGPLDRLRHRGPDAEGFERLAVGVHEVELGHRRLAILDLDARANQPMAWRSGRYRLVFNGEIYNYVELRDALERGGQTFRTASDSEVLIAAWHVWGPAALGRMIGMFAFVLIDVEAGEAVIARDVFGIKPLYLARPRGGLALASEPAALLDVPGVSRAVNPAAARLYIRRGVTDAGGDTLFADIAAFPAAHYARIDLRRKRVVLDPIRFWQPAGEAREETSEQAAERVRAALLESVKLHLRSDVPVGTALSGGLDSSAIVGAVRAVGGPDLKLQTFSFVAPGEAMDESRWIDIVAGQAGYENRKVSASGATFTQDLDTLIRLQGEPFGSSSIYAQFLVMRLAREHGVKVMLDGQGGDELFGGYRLFLAARIAELLRKGRIGAATGLALAAARQPDVRLPGLVYNVLDRVTARGLPAVVHRRLGRDAIAKVLLDERWLDGRDREPAPLRPRSLKDEMSYALTEGVLPALLRYEDRNSMHVSIEARVPFLTTPMAEAALSCAPEAFIGADGTRKWVLRRAIRGLVPDAVIDRRDKISFETPERRWLLENAAWCDKVLDRAVVDRMPLFRPGAVAGYYERWKRDAGAGYDTFAFWRIVNFVRWATLFDVSFAA